MVALAGAAGLHGADTTARQAPFSREALVARTPAARTVSYQLNGRVRPLLFWIGRDNIGEASITWRHHPSGRRAYELLVGTDPARAPRDLNRWGFIVEEVDGNEATIFGLMKETNEQTLEDAEAAVARKDGISVFKAAHTAISGGLARTATMTMEASADLTFRDVDTLLTRLASTPTRMRETPVPPATLPGFLVALDALIAESLKPCGRHDGVSQATPTSVRYLYNHTSYDLMLVSCTFESELRTESSVVPDVIDGRFRLRNRTTKHDTRFRVLYGSAGEFSGIPLRVVFRPQWWMEIELAIGAPVRHSASRPADEGWQQRKEGS